MTSSSIATETAATTTGKVVPLWKRTFLPLPFCARRATRDADELLDVLEATSRRGYRLNPVNRGSGLAEQEVGVRRGDRRRRHISFHMDPRPGAHLGGFIRMTHEVTHGFHE